MTEERAIELEITVAGTPEEVWRAIATGPGISSWYVPHDIEEFEGGAGNASFGPGMDAPGVVAVWEPPRRVKFEGVDGGSGMAFEWFVEAIDGGSCIVRLVNSGFGTGTEWDDHYDAMHDGWLMFLHNLRLHLEHFAGQSGTASLPMGMWALSPADSWALAADAFGFDAALGVGDQVTIAAPGAPTVSGTVTEIGAERASFLMAEPAPGTGFVTAEGQGEATTFSIWVYLYGDDASDLAATHYEQWMPVLAAAGPPMQMPDAPTAE